MYRYVATGNLDQEQPVPKLFGPAGFFPTSPSMISVSDEPIV